MEFVAVVEFKAGGTATFVTRYTFNREGLGEMCSDIYCAIKCGAHSVSIADGYVEVELPELGVWFDLSSSEIKNRIVWILSDATMDKKDFERCVRAAVDLMIGSSATAHSVD